jgi:N-acetylmuramoyl-L-alanine amidase
MKKKLLIPAVASIGVLLGASPSFAYEVKKGDTMFKIAKEHNVELSTLAEMNPNVENIDLIYVGDTINTSMNKETNIVTNKNVRVDIGSYEEGLLARLVEAEANGESFAGKVAVARVVLNRVESSEFPDSISEVIYQAGQFSPVSNGSINRSASEDSKRAVLEAMKQGNDGSLFFYNPRTATSRWLDGKPTVKVIGNHTFK